MSARIRILPIFIAVAALGLAFKLNNIFVGVEAMVQPAVAQEEGQSETARQGGTGTAGAAQGQAAGTPRANTAAGEPIDPLLMSRAELDLLQDLANRRTQLDEREREMSVRLRLLEATERRIDDKIARLESLETRMADLVRSYEDNENQQMQSLVKVYETMKPKDAARIFERLDMSIQIEVATRMKEAKMAPIMAAMSAEAAEALTNELASRAILPELDGS